MRPRNQGDLPPQLNIVTNRGKVLCGRTCTPLRDKADVFNHNLTFALVGVWDVFGN